MIEAERETYVRHNVRTLRYEHPSARMWRMLARYLYEYQYLGGHLAMTAIGDPYGYFLASTAAGIDLVEPGIITEERWRGLLDATARVLAACAVDASKIRLPAGRVGAP
jgi:hypothetical protein